MHEYGPSFGAAAPGNELRRLTHAILALACPLWTLGICSSLSCSSATRDARVDEPLRHPSPVQPQEPTPSPDASAPPAPLQQPSVHSGGSRSISAADAVAAGRDELVRREVDPDRYSVSARRAQLSWNLTFTPKPPVNRTLKIFMQVGLRGKVLGFRRIE